MTSEERHKARYERRVKRRQEKRKAKLSKYDNFNNVAGYDELYRAYMRARKGVSWKASVQRFTLNKSKNIFILHHKLIKGEDIRKGFIPFDIIERGKRRHIESVHFSERIPQKALSTNVLTPVLSNSLIYDNGASREGMGVSHAIGRVERHLHEYFRKYGNEGWVLQIDLKDYFASIPHDEMKQIIRNSFCDERIIALTNSFIDAFAEDKAKRLGGRPEDYAVGLGLGSEICQICAIAYPNSIDHFIKEKARRHWYERYNDDSVILIRSKDKAEELLATIKKLYEEKGIRLNEKKTKIIKISKGFTFLKTKFILTSTGKVIKKLVRKSITVMRRKLKKFKKFLDADVMEMKYITQSYQSWRGYAGHKNANKTIYTMDRLFCKLFNINFKQFEKEEKENERKRKARKARKNSSRNQRFTESLAAA